MDKIASRTHRAEMPGLWALEIRGAGLGHRYICRARSESDAADQAGRLMGATHGATGADIYWIDNAHLLSDGQGTPAQGDQWEVWDEGRWTALIAAHDASEQAAPERRSAAD